MMERQHKIAILKYTKGNFWLLIFPLARGLVSMNFDFFHWIKGAYLDIIVILIIFGLAMLKWNFTRFETREKEIYVKEGVLFRSEFALPYAAISSASCCKSFLLRPFKAVKISLDSDSHSFSEKRSRADITLIIVETKCSQLFNKIPKQSTGIKVTYKVSKKDLVIFSLLFSSTLSGIIFMATFFIQGSRLVGERLDEEIFSAVSSVTEAVKKVAEGATTFSVALTIIIAAGWLISFARNLLRYIRFGITRRGENIAVESGHFSRWKYYVNYSRINYADLRQNLLMKISKIMSVHVSCTGYGKSKNEIPVFVPITTRQRVMSTMEMMLPDFTQSNITLKPKSTYIMAFIWLPLVMTVAVPIAAVAASRIFSGWEGAVKFLAVMAEIPSLYLLAVKISARLSTGIGVGRETLTVKYCHAYRFHTVIVPKSRVAYIKIRRTPFQRVSGCCDVVIYTRGERVKGHKVRGLQLDAAENFARNYDTIG